MLFDLHKYLYLINQRSNKTDSNKGSSFIQQSSLCSLRAVSRLVAFQTDPKTFEQNTAQCNVTVKENQKEGETVSSTKE